MPNWVVSRYQRGTLTAQFRKMLEQDRSGESSSHEDAIASCSRAKVSHQDRLENQYGQKVRSVSSRETESIENLSTRPYDRQQSAAKQAIKRAKLLESKVKIRQRKNLASDIEVLTVIIEKLTGDFEALKEEVKKVKRTLATMRSCEGTGRTPKGVSR